MYLSPRTDLEEVYKVAIGIRDDFLRERYGVLPPLAEEFFPLFTNATPEFRVKLKSEMGKYINARIGPHFKNQRGKAIREYG